MNWDNIAAQVSNFLNAAAPLVNGVVATFAPEASAGLSISEKLLQGVIAAEPTAVALVQQVANGTPLTGAQIAAFEANYETDYQKTKADIAAALAALPAQ